MYIRNMREVQHAIRKIPFGDNDFHAFPTTWRITRIVLVFRNPHCPYQIRVSEFDFIGSTHEEVGRLSRSIIRRKTCPTVDTRCSHDRRRPDVSFSPRQLCKSVSGFSIFRRSSAFDEWCERNCAIIAPSSCAISRMWSTPYAFLLFKYETWCSETRSFRIVFFGSEL